LFKRISDTDIINGIRDQDDRILNWLYNNYLPTIRKHIMNNSGTNDDVSDVFQDTIIVLFRQIAGNKLNLTSDLKGYFFGVARKIWSAQLRRKRRMTELDLDFPEEQGHEESIELMFERIINRAFSKLKPDMQEVLTLYFEGYSYVEIAERMNFKNETYARRKKYLSKETLMELIREDHEYQEYLRFRK